MCSEFTIRARELKLALLQHEPFSNLASEMKRILLVEDDDAIRRSLEKILTKSGFIAVEAANGREALAAYDPGTIDAVVLDIIMPDVEGLETLRTWRRTSPGVRVLAISGGGQICAEDYLVLAAKLGAQETLAKPFTAATFLEALHRLLALPMLPPPASLENRTTPGESSPSVGI